MPKTKEPKPFKGKIPWTNKGPCMYDGGPTYYDYEAGKHLPVEYRDNTPFTATMVFDSFYRGRSAAGALFRDRDNPKVLYPVRSTCLKKIILSKVMNEGVVHGTFAITKQGANYSLLLAED